MKLSQSQVREITGLTEPTLRVWARCVQPLEALKGKGLNYTLGDVVALMVVGNAVKQLGCPISSLAPNAPSLFRACAKLAITTSSQGGVIIRENSVSLIQGDEPVAWTMSDDPFIFVPLAPLLSRLSAWLGQGQLSLPL